MKTLSLLLCLGLLLQGPALRAEESPELPDSQEKVEEAPENVDGPKEVDTPEGDPEAQKESIKVTHKKPARFRFKNLILGALSGAFLGGGVAVLFFSQDPKTGGIDRDKLPATASLGAGIGAAAGGTLGFLLGATTPTGPLPPEMQTQLPALETPLFAGPHLAYSLRF